MASCYVPLQHRPVTDRRVLTSEDAARTCRDMGVQRMLDELNRLMQSSLRLADMQLRRLLISFIYQNLDFGTVYARVHSSWPDPFERFDMEATLAERLSELEKVGEDQQREREASIEGDAIVRPYYIKPRRLWDLFSHRVIPYHYTLGSGGVLAPNYWAISHSWTDDMVGVQTPVNAFGWPVPVPAGVTLELVRAELLNLGIEYVWLDVLCLRQSSADPVREEQRKREWAIDVPTIGTVYVSGAFKVVRYMNGLGKAFETFGWEGPRHWLNRAWTLQEMKLDSVIGGVPDGVMDPLNERSDEEGTVLSERLALVTQIEPMQDALVTAREFSNIILAMHQRFSTNPIDKIAGIAMLFHCATLPLYDVAKTEEDAWALCVRHLPPTLHAELLFRFHEPGDGDVSWRPSWRQLMLEEFSAKSNRPIVAEVKKVGNNGSAYYEGPCLVAQYSPVEQVGTTEAYAQGLIKIERRGVQEVFGVRAFGGQAAAAEGIYTLLGDVLLETWVLCERRDDLKLRKITALGMSEAEADRLKNTRACSRRGCILV